MPYQTTLSASDSMRCGMSAGDWNRHVFTQADGFKDYLGMHGTEEGGKDEKNRKD